MTETGDSRHNTVDAVNRALRDLGRRHAAGEIQRGEYRQLRRELVAEVTGDRVQDDAPPTGRYPPIRTQTDTRLRFWLVPLVLAAIGLGALLALAWFVWK